MATIRHAALVMLVLVLSGSCSAFEPPGTIQLEMANVARARAASSLMIQSREQQTDVRDSATDPVAVEALVRSQDGSHTVQVVVGGQTRELIIDTGSGKTALVCEGCENCGSSHTHTPFLWTINTSYVPCDPNHLAREDSHNGGCQACDHGKCKYGQSYVEGDHWMAYKVSDVLALSPTFATSIEFGCIFEESGVFTRQIADGIMGFSRHPDAIYEQFYHRNATQSRIFTQCLTKHGGLLTLGGVDMTRHSTPVQYTPLRDTGFQYWTVSLLSVTVGSELNKVEANEVEYNADKGCVLDSGTTYLYLPRSMKGAFTAAWSRAVGSLEHFPEGVTFHTLTDEELRSFPDICFHFVNAAQLCLSPSRYFETVEENEYMGTLYFDDVAGGVVIGASVMEGHDVIFDVDNHRVGFAEAACDLQQPPAMVELSLDPGGDKFQANWDFSQAPQWMLVAVTMLALVGLVNSIWVATVMERELLKDAKVRQEIPQRAEGTRPRMTTSEEALDGGDWHSHEFSFFLMQEDE